MMKRQFVLVAVCLLYFLRSGCNHPQPQSAQLKNQVTRFGSLIKLKKEYEERYIILHRHTFPAVLDRIRRCNIRNYTIFLKEGMLFSHFEYIGKNFEADMTQMADSVTKDWWKLTDPMQEPLDNRKEGEWWVSINLFYQMETSKTGYQNSTRIALIGDLKPNQEERLKKIINQLDNRFAANVLDHNFQNLTLYNREERIYLYLEYIGHTFAEDRERALNEKSIRDLTDELNKIMVPVDDKGRFWQTMTEIFHTD